MPLHAEEGVTGVLGPPPPPSSQQLPQLSLLPNSDDCAAAGTAAAALDSDLLSSPLRSAAASTASAAASAATATPTMLWPDMTCAEREALDAEGRCLITDHGAFVLFNVYGVAVTAEDPAVAQQRADFKLAFFKVRRRLSRVASIAIHRSLQHASLRSAAAPAASPTAPGLRSLLCFC